MRPTLAVVYHFGMPAAPFEEFADKVNGESLTVHLEAREDPGPYAGITWTLMTMGAVYIASNYFGGMLKELGKDHYMVLKDALARLTEKTMELPRIEPVLFGSAGKVRQDDPFSMGFSVWAELPNDRKVKLLIPKAAHNVEYARITDSFLDFVKRFHEEGDCVLEQIGFEISRRSNPITVAYNTESGKIEYRNPFPD